VAQVGRPRISTTGRAAASSAAFIGESNFLPAIVRGVEDDVVVAECDGRSSALCLQPTGRGEKVIAPRRGRRRIRFTDGACIRPRRRTAST